MNENARTGAVGLGSGVTLGGPLGVMLNHFFTVSPLHWYAPSDDVMVSAVTGGAMTFMGIVALLINHFVTTPRRAAAPPPDDTKGAP